MAVNSTPPERFDFSRPDDWPRWKRRFEQFVTAANLDSAENARLISTLLYCLGEEGEAVLTSTNITDNERKVYKTVLQKLDEFFQVRRNIILEQAKFNLRAQKLGETAEQYITALYTLVENCEYGALKQEMLRDRLVVSIRDSQLSQKLQADASLTLEKAKVAIRQREAVQEQNAQLEDGRRGDTTVDETADEVRHQKKPHRPSKNRGGAANQNSKPQQVKGVAKYRKGNQCCTRCGQDKHLPGEKCPAQGATCKRCHKKGHNAAQCWSKGVASVEAGLDSAFLGMVASSYKTQWRATLKLEGTEVSFKYDTGAEVTVISHATYLSLKRKQPLEKASKALFGPTHQNLNVVGQFTGQITHEQTKSSSLEMIFVVKELNNNLLGLPALISLNVGATNRLHQ